MRVAFGSSITLLFALAAPSLAWAFGPQPSGRRTPEPARASPLDLPPGAGLGLDGPERVAPSGAYNLLEVGLSSGAFLPSSHHELYASTLTYHAPFRTAGLDLSLRLGLFPLPFLGAELEGGYSPIETLAGKPANVLVARGHVVLQLPGAFSPFVLAGGGTIGVLSKPDALGDDFDRAFHWGGGFKYHVSDRVALRVDVRDIFSASYGPSAGNTHHVEVLAGVSIALARLWPSEPVLDALVVTEPEVAPDTVVVETVAAMRPANELVAPTDCTKAAQNPRCRPEQVVQAELDRVHFAWGSPHLEARDFPALDNAAEVLQGHPNLDVEIRGHTDSTGPQAFNMYLSMARAEAVRSYLMAKGIAAERLSTSGHGPFEPVDSNQTSHGRAQNRRGEITVVDRVTGRTSARPE